MYKLKRLCENFDQESKDQFSQIIYRFCIIYLEKITALATELRTARGTLIRWGLGHSAPPLIARKKIVEIIKRELV